ncbi:MAG: hypothetical protein ACFFBD_13425, partial [Candidatus Hodarchaeota archaeon]
MSTRILQGKPWVCDCCPSPCSTKLSFETIPLEFFDLLEKALTFDARVFFSLCCEHKDNGFCVAAQFFQKAEKLRTSLTKNQIRLLKEVFTETWNILNNNPLKQATPPHEGSSVKKKIQFKCICGSEVNLTLSKAELKSKSAHTDPFPVTLSHQTENGAI